MNAQFHKLVPLLVLQQMPEQFRAFFICENYTEEQLKIDADKPDEVDRDNLEQDSILKHAHSYKLQEITDAKGNKYLEYIEGDCLKKLDVLASMARDYYLEKDFTQARYCLAKLTHYVVDGRTFPHLWHGRPWNTYHQKFEDQMGDFLVAHQGEIGPLEFEVSKNIYKTAKAASEKAWYEGRDLVAVYEAGGSISDEQAMKVCRDEAQAIGSMWMTLATELKLI